MRTRCKGMGSIAPYLLMGTLMAQSLVAPTLMAQSHEGETMIFSKASTSDRSFALVLGSSVQVVKVNWRQGDAFEEYANRHAGRYIVFEQDGELHRLDSAEKVNEVAGLYAPMQDLQARQNKLTAQQKPLTAQQKPLTAQQRELSAAMRDAASPEAMQSIGKAQGSLGRQQGEIGRQQGEIGRQQGEIGRQQGELGRALNQKVQQLFNECLKDGSCPRVGG